MKIPKDNVVLSSQEDKDSRLEGEPLVHLGASDGIISIRHNINKRRELNALLNKKSEDFTEEKKQALLFRLTSEVSASSNFNENHSKRNRRVKSNDAPETIKLESIGNQSRTEVSPPDKTYTDIGKQEMKHPNEVKDLQETKESQEIKKSQETKEPQEIKKSQEIKDSQKITEQAIKEPQETNESQKAKKPQEMKDSQET
eukprot:TRINITY_DN3909_c0_g1_i1.p1 TRINITY_DN3909_c0_g1~~TRINITY_DN3909_c0_g1_i1.p1  ORF type:complete len:200 (-),score=50.80 TRINITY_DN3909_c0_g1_i1:3-602(-)